MVTSPAEAALAPPLHSPLTRVRRALRNRPEPAGLVLLVLVAMLGPGHFLGGSAIPGESLGLGVFAAGPLALNVVGLLLVFRSNRVINFSQLALGSVSGTLFFNLMAHRTFIHLYITVCGCLPQDAAVAPYGWQVANTVLALVFSLLAAPLVGFLVYLLVVRKFAAAPPLLLTVVTIGIAYLVPTMATHLAQQFPDEGAVAVLLPVDLIFTAGTASFHLPQLLALLLVVGGGGGLAWFLRTTPTGTVLRAAADNAARAQTLGVSVGHMGALVWTIAGTLSGVAAVLLAAQNQQPPALDVQTLVVLMAALVVARASSLVLGVAAVFALSIAHEAMLYNIGNDAIFDGVLLLVVGVFLALRRSRGARGDLESAGDWEPATEVRPIPAEMRRLPQVRRPLVILGAIGLAAAVGIPWLVSPTQADIATEAMIDAIVGLSLLVLTGWAGQVSLGQFAFAAIGAWTMTMLMAHSGFPFFIALPVAAILGGVLAAVIGFPALRLPGLNLAVVTLVFALAVPALLLGPQFGGAGLPAVLNRPSILGLNGDDQRTFYYLVLLCLAACFTMVVGLRRSRTARALIACRDNPQAAQSLGVSLVRIRLQAFAISGFLAAFAGGLLALQQHGVHAPGYGSENGLREFLVSVIGGLGSVWGPLIGNGVDGFVKLIGIPILQELFVGGGVILLLLVAPGGLGGIVYRVRDARLRRIAARLHIDVPSLTADRRRSASAAQAPLAPLPQRAGAQSLTVREYRPRRQWGILPATPGAEERR